MHPSYWQDTAPTFTDADQQIGDEKHYDVAVIGGGFTGLSAARALAKRGVRTVLLEAASIGCGASARNGGHLNNGTAHSFLAAEKTLGASRAKTLYQAFDRSIDLIEHIIAEEKIDCDFRRSGKIKLAAKPAHFDALKANHAALSKGIDADTELLTKQDLASEIGSDAFHGGLLWKKSAMMHMGKYVTGLAQAAARHGADIFENNPVLQRRCKNGRHQLVTPTGQISCRHVLLATGAETKGPFGYFRRRIVPVGSFITATRPLSASEKARFFPGNRTYVTTKNVGNYFRLSADGRLIFGGRARFAAKADARDEAKSREILQAQIAELFPDLQPIDIDYCWGGLVDMTQDRFPRAGFANNVWFALGYSGHGAQLSTLMGLALADAIMGDAETPNPVEGLSWSALPLYTGHPWFLPFVGAYYRYKDLVS